MTTAADFAKRARMVQFTQRPLYQIAHEIHRDWGKAKHRIYFGAVPYLRAMMELDKITDKYGEDSAKSIVLYFLSNAATWRGEVARRVKAELKRMVAAENGRPHTESP